MGKYPLRKLRRREHVAKPHLGITLDLANLEIYIFCRSAAGVFRGFLSGTEWSSSIHERVGLHFVGPAFSNIILVDSLSIDSPVHCCINILCVVYMTYMISC